MVNTLWVGFANETNEILATSEDYEATDESCQVWHVTTGKTFYLRRFVLVDEEEREIVKDKIRELLDDL
jgi:hypothetical protein